MLKFKVNHQIITRTDSFEAVADSINYLKAHFDFTEEWQGIMIALFCHDDKYYSVVLENGSCVVPWEVIKAPFFTVSLVCGNRITTDTVIVDVARSDFCEEKTPQPPTPDIYSQIINLCNEAMNIAKSVREDADSGKFKGDKGDTGYTPRRGIDYWTEADKKSLEEYIDKQITPIEMVLTANADAVIEPVISGITERLVFNSTFPGIKYQVFAGETPFNTEPYDMSLSVTTARLGFEGDGITIKFFDDSGEYVCTMKPEVTGTINNFKLCRLKEV